MRGHLTSQPSLPWQGSTPAAAQASYEASVRAQETAPAMCARLLQHLIACGERGATDAEIERDLGWAVNIITARRNELVNAGQVVASIHRRPTIKPTRPGKRSLRVTVWLAVRVIERRRSAA